MRKSRRLLVGLGPVLVLLAATLLPAHEPAAVTAAEPAAVTTQAAGKRPNVVLVMADDMRVDDLKFAPNLRRIVAEHGIVFENAFSPFPLCCPARASFLTGQYAHNHRVYWHEPPYGYGSFDDSRTLATSLRAAGYRTGFVGKYLNRYGVDRSKVSGRPSARYVPRGWSDWRAAIENNHTGQYTGSTYNYFNTPFNVNGRVVNSFKGRYQSNVLGDISVGMARRFARSGDPFFMYVNYVAPHHGGPGESDDPRNVHLADGRRISIKTPARPRWVRGKFDNIITRASGIAKTGELTERDLSDKPRPVQRRAQPLGREARRALRTATRQRAESIYVMDRNIARLVRALKDSGEWSNTVFAFTSDNGMMIGEHQKALTKVHAYEPSLRVPLLMTGPGLRTAQRRYDPISTVDLTATILDIADAAPPRTADGISRWPSITGGDRGWSTPVISEAIHTSGGSDPAFRDARSTIGIRTSRYNYVRYRDGGGELYDLVRDPRQDHNVYRAAAYDSIRRTLDGLWLRVKDCRGDQCRVRLPDTLLADPATNRTQTRAYWTGIKRGYSW